MELPDTLPDDYGAPTPAISFAEAMRRPSDPPNNTLVPEYGATREERRAEQADLQQLASYPILRRGDKGDFVKTAQTQLQARGYYRDGKVDGDFRDKTERAVLDFQRVSGIPATGIVDTATWYALYGLQTAAKRSERNAAANAALLDVAQGLAAGVATAFVPSQYSQQPVVQPPPPPTPEWQKYALLAGGVLVFGGVVYMIFRD